MGKVTTKLQVTVPKAIAERYGIKPGDQIQWEAAGDAIRVVPGGVARDEGAVAERLRLFDESTSRQQMRNRAIRASRPARARGWTREELYERGRTR